jgi:hypothetical protein
VSVGPRRQCFSPQAHDKCAPTAERTERQHEKCTPTGCIPAQEKRPPRRCPGRPVVTTLWSDDRTAGVADEERGHAEIRHGQHDARLLAGQDGTSPVLLDGFAHGAAPLGRVGWPTHRNVVDRGRPYAPFPVGTTPFLEFVEEFPDRGPPHRPEHPPAGSLSCPHRRPFLPRGRARTRAGRVGAWHTFLSAEVLAPGLPGGRPGLSAAPGRVPDVPDRPPDADEPRAGPTTGDAPP